MKSTNNVQTTEAMNKSAIAPQWEACIIEELSDEAASSVSGGWRLIIADPRKPMTAEQYNKYAGFWGG
jgi:hypothetical protein